MQDYLDADWQALFAANGLDGFAAWWQRQAEWFEWFKEPNRRRNGWSGVARVVLKCQENHNTFSRCHPLRGVPTFLREYAPGWSRTGRLRFLKRYLGVGWLTFRAKWLRYRLAARQIRKFTVRA